MHKAVRIILLIIIGPCSLIGFGFMADEFISNFDQILASHYALDPGFLLVSLFSLLSIPVVIFNLKFLRKRKVKLNSIIDNEFSIVLKEIHLPKWIFIGNALFGLYALILGLFLFIDIDFTRTPDPEDWIRNVVILVLLITGIMVLLDKKQIGAVKNWITDLYRPPWETRRMH